MEKEYVLSFSSFYQAAYAKDLLRSVGVAATLRKLPAELVHACGTGLYLRTGSIQRVKEVLQRKRIVPRGVYEVAGGRPGRETYLRV